MDLRGYEDLDEFMSETDDPLVELSQDVFHRMIEGYGSNLDIDADASLGLETVLHGDLEVIQSSLIEAGLRKDDRIDNAKAVITEVEDGRATGPRAVRCEVLLAVNESQIGIVIEADGTVLRRVAT